MILRVYTVSNIEQDTKISVDAILFAIEQVTTETVDIVYSFKIDTSRPYIAYLGYKPCRKLPLYVQKIVLAILYFDVRIDYKTGDTYCAPPARTSTRSVVEPTSKLTETSVVCPT